MTITNTKEAANHLYQVHITPSFTKELLKNSCSPSPKTVTQLLNARPEKQSLILPLIPSKETSSEEASNMILEDLITSLKTHLAWLPFEVTLEQDHEDIYYQSDYLLMKNKFLVTDQALLYNPNDDQQALGADFRAHMLKEGAIGEFLKRLYNKFKKLFKSFWILISRIARTIEVKQEVEMNDFFSNINCANLIWIENPRIEYLNSWG